MHLAWRRGERVRLSLSDSAERPGSALEGMVPLAGRGTAIVRVDR